MAGRAPPKSKDKARRLFSARPLLTRDTAQAHPRARLLPSKAPFSLEGKERAGEEETVVPAKAGDDLRCLFHTLGNRMKHAQYELDTKET